MNRIEAHIALHEAKARYCRYLDTKDWERFGDLLTEDFELDLSRASDLGIINGRDNALRQIRSSIESAVTVHQVHSPEITLAADEARVIWAVNDRVIWASDRPSLLGFGHYHERWVYRDGEWKLAAQQLTRLHVDMLPATGPTTLQQTGEAGS